MACCGNWRKCRAVMPDIKGLQAFGGEVIDACEYKSGEKYSGKKNILIAGCGNSGMEVSLDLCSQNPKLSMVSEAPQLTINVKNRCLPRVFSVL